MNARSAALGALMLLVVDRVVDLPSSASGITSRLYFTLTTLKIGGGTHYEITPGPSGFGLLLLVFFAAGGDHLPTGFFFSPPFPPTGGRAGADRVAFPPFGPALL